MWGGISGLLTGGALAALAAFPAEAALLFGSRDLGADAELARLRPPDEFELGEAPEGRGRGAENVS
jgi:hypothetical protein